MAAAIEERLRGLDRVAEQDEIIIENADRERTEPKPRRGTSGVPGIAVHRVLLFDVVGMERFGLRGCKQPWAGLGRGFIGGVRLSKRAAALYSAPKHRSASY